MGYYITPAMIIPEAKKLMQTVVDCRDLESKYAEDMIPVSVDFKVKYHASQKMR